MPVGSAALCRLQSNVESGNDSSESTLMRLILFAVARVTRASAAQIDGRINFFLTSPAADGSIAFPPSIHAGTGFRFMGRGLKKIQVLAALSLCAPPSLLVLALIGRSVELLILGFLTTILALLINSVLLVVLFLLWFTGVEKVKARKLILWMSLLCAGVVTNVVILWLMPPLAK